MLTIFCSKTTVKALTLYYLNLNNRIFLFNYVVRSFTEKSILNVLIFILIKKFFSNMKNVNSNMKKIKSSIKKTVILILRVIARVNKILEKMELRQLLKSSIIGTFLNNTSILPPSFITIKPFLLGYHKKVVIKTKRYFHTLNMESLNFNIP